MQHNTVNVGDLVRGFTMVAKASGDAIIVGSVSYYLKALTGANAGKWWKNSDQTWDASETANAMTHVSKGHWAITLAATPFASGVLFMEYAQESGDLNVPDGRLLKGFPAPDAAGGLPTTTKITDARLGVLTDWIDDGRLDEILDAVSGVPAITLSTEGTNLSSED